MMVDETTKKYGVIGLIALLIGGGLGGEFFSEEELNNAWICPLTEQWGYFERFSSTLKTAYYTEGGEEISVSCRSGRTYAAWEKLTVWLEINGYDLNDFLSKDSIVIPEGSELTTIEANGQNWACITNGILDRATQCTGADGSKIHAGALL